MDDSTADDISLAGLVQTIWKSKRAMLGGMAACLFCALVYMHIAQFTYTISLQVTPVDATAQTASSLSGLASAVGLGASLSSPNWNLYNAALQSSMAAAGVLQRPDLMHLIFYKEWTGAGWRSSDGGILHSVKNMVYYILGIPVTPLGPPGLNDVQLFLEKKLAVVPDRKTSTIELSLQWPDPVAGRKILSGISEIVDDLVRSRDLVRAENYSNYASAELQKASIIEYREALAQLLLQQEQRKMVASARLPFAAQPLGQVISSSKPTSPPAIAIILLSFPVGAFLGVMLDYLRRRLRGAAPVAIG